MVCRSLAQPRTRWWPGALTTIYFLLARGERSHWHRVDYAGAPLALDMVPDDAAAPSAGLRHRASRECQCRPAGIVSPVRDAHWQAVAALTVTELAGGDLPLGRAPRAPHAPDSLGFGRRIGGASVGGAVSAAVVVAASYAPRRYMPRLALIAPYHAEIAADRQPPAGGGGDDADWPALH